MATTELIYTPGRGKAELIRMVLAACGVEFVEHPVTTREEFLAIRPKLLFGQIPELIINGQKIVQTNAIVRHLARTHNLDGKDGMEKMKVDQYYEGTRDFYASFIAIGFNVPFAEISNRTKSSIDRYLPIYEKILKDNGSTGYLVGSSLTVADIGLLEVLLAIEDYIDDDSVFHPYPEIQNFMSKMREQSFYGNYYNKVRMPKNTPEYIENVKKIFAI